MSSPLISASTSSTCLFSVTASATEGKKPQALSPHTFEGSSPFLYTHTHTHTHTRTHTHAHTLAPPLSYTRRLVTIQSWGSCWVSSKCTVPHPQQKASPQEQVRRGQCACFQSFIQFQGHTEHQQGVSPVLGIVGDPTPAPGGSSLTEQSCTTNGLPAC